MSGGASGSISKASSNFDQNVWGPQAWSLARLYNQGNDLYNQTNEAMQGRIPGTVDSMQSINNQANPAWQNQLLGGAYRDMGLQDQLTNSLNQFLSAIQSASVKAK